MPREYSFLHHYFDSKLRADSSARYFPRNLIDNFESRITNSFQLDNENGVNVPPYTCSFSTMPSEYGIISVADEDGQLRLINVSKPTKYSVISTWNCHTNAVFDTKWLPGERTILTASGDQTLALHDLISRKQLMSFLGHSSSVRTVDLQTNCADVFTSASRDGTIRLWDRRNSKTMKRRGVSGVSCVHCLTACHQPTTTVRNAVRNAKGRPRRRLSDVDVGGPDQSVTSVAFISDHEIASCGSSDGRIKIWDTRKFTSRGISKPSVEIPYLGDSKKSCIGYSHLLVDHVNSRLFALCRDHVIYQFGLSNTERPQMTYRGHVASSFYIRASLSPDRASLICGSGDCNAYIYPIDRPDTLPVMLRGFEGEVTEVKWSPHDPTLIVALSDDCWIRMWRTSVATGGVTRQPEDLWGLAERCRHSVRGRDEGSMVKDKPVKPEGCPNSAVVRQLNIESFLTTPSKVKREAFSLMERQTASLTLPISPKKLVISPRKQSATERSLKRCFEGDSPVRKRLRFDSEETSSVLREIQETPSPRRKRTDGTENIQPKSSSKNRTSSSRKSVSRRSLDSKKMIPITQFFHRSTPR